MAWVIHALCWSCCFRSPCLALLKLKDWNPPVSADESMTSTPYSLWFRRYSVTAMTSTTTVTTPAARPEYSATSLLLSISARRRENTFEEKYTMTKQWLWFFWKWLYKRYLFIRSNFHQIAQGSHFDVYRCNTATNKWHNHKTPSSQNSCFLS